MSYGDKIQFHPDKDEIVTRLLAGEGVTSVSNWLKTKYPTNKRKWVSYLTLQRYRQEHLQLKGEVLREVKETTRDLVAERIDDQKSIALRDSTPYEAAKLTIAKDILKTDTLILDIHDKIWERIRLLEQESVNYKNDSVIVEYISQMRQLMSDYHKMIIDIEKLGKKEDGPTNIQIEIQQTQQQINTLKQIVLELLQEMSPDMVPIFLERMKERMDKLMPATVSIQVKK